MSTVQHSTKHELERDGVRFRLVAVSVTRWLAVRTVALGAQHFAMYRATDTLSKLRIHRAIEFKSQIEKYHRRHERTSTNCTCNCFAIS